jgi:hypothetical protein
MKSSQPGIRKYVIGLSVLLLFVLGLVVWLLIQASAVKADNTTYKSATKLASKLNDYISTKNKIPNDLKSVSKDAVPSSIRYTKLSEQRYKFCVTYNANSSNFDATSVQTGLMSRAFGGGLDYYGGNESSELSYLYIPSTHKKGENCQTIKPYIYSYKPAPVCNYDYSSGSAAYNEYLLCMQSGSSGKFQSDGNTPNFY